MTYKRLTNWFDSAQSVGENQDYILADLPARFVHITLGTIETRKARAIWASDEDWRDGVDALYDFMERLLMDATDRIVTEVRALRDGAFTPLDARDPQLSPYDLPLTSLGTIDGRLQTGLADVIAGVQTSNALLTEIRDGLAAQQGGDLQEVLDKMDAIALLLAAL